MPPKFKLPSAASAAATASLPPLPSEEMEEDRLLSDSRSSSLKRPRTCESATVASIDNELQASWATREPTEDDLEGPWEKATTRTQRRALLRKSGQPLPISSRKTRATLGTHIIKLQPMERCDVTLIDPEDLQTTINSYATDLKLIQHQILRVSRLSNTIAVTTCDSNQAALLLRVKSLPLRSRPPLPVRTYQVPTEGISRGVVYRCKPGETTEKLLAALSADGVDILAARPMGSRGTVLITFASPHPPREVTYWGFPRRVEQYERRALVCPRCHRPGHKAAVCPTETAVCSNCGQQHEQPPEQCPSGDSKYCVNCKQTSHVATDPSCPTRAQFAQRAKQQEKAKNVRRSRSRSRRRGPQDHQLTAASRTRSNSCSSTSSRPRTPHRVRISEQPRSYTPTGEGHPKDRPTSDTQQLIDKLQAEQARDQANFDRTVQQLRHQLEAIQRIVVDTTQKYDQRRRSREGRLRSLRLKQKEDEPQQESELIEKTKRRQSPSPRRNPVPLAPSPRTAVSPQTQTLMSSPQPTAEQFPPDTPAFVRQIQQTQQVQQSMLHTFQNALQQQQQATQQALQQLEQQLQQVIRTIAPLVNQHGSAQRAEHQPGADRTP